MRRLKRKLVWSLGTVAIVVLLVVLAVYQRPQPPVSGLKTAREALLAAQNTNAVRYASEAYVEAKTAYDSAMHYWAVENDRFILARNYSTVEYWVAQTLRKAVEAGELSGRRAASADNRLKQALQEAENQSRLYDRYYKHLPLPAAVTRNHNRGVMKLAEAKFSWQNRRFNEAEAHLAEAEGLLHHSNEKAEALVRAWFGAHSSWQKQTQQAIRQSNGGQKVILVDKLAHRCVVYQTGKIIRTFDVELGINWLGDKQRKGDKATPEGVYRISRKKAGGQTKFYKALLLNYPNDRDRARFAAAKRNGSLSAKADIGSLIEIHGMGGKGVDWTDGCIALHNQDMDALFRLVSVGTPVFIVGSVRPLNEVLGE
ncbi:murein L,D-transpeptidase family protein [Mangrovibacterium marinum]|uniref:L,D-transpeptidase-like protein n=1 Tax=Mangrovibacterium marinum TaxID=1639118 RepID=A0A2T5C2B8_9BACT|nr:L,D-transpeptidase [Mangrovibacterium marinum]PTN08820.1 L,D-transpeptidase-like protein [Mangrovibacterium marinum]